MIANLSLSVMLQIVLVIFIAWGTAKTIDAAYQAADRRRRYFERNRREGRESLYRRLKQSRR
jgi:hypothetical protein